MAGNRSLPSNKRRRKHWGWGYADEQPRLSKLQAARQALEERVGFALPPPRAPTPLAKANLPPIRLAPPPPLRPFCSLTSRERARHAYGSSFADVLRGFEGRFESAPDLVVFPRSEEEIAQTIAFCEDHKVALIPYGGGTSVVGGVEGRVPSTYNGVISLDLRHLAGVKEVESTSRAALVGAGTSGPVLEEGLRPFGLCFRHYPQSHQFSTVGGWIATRAAGHFATGPTHVEDRVEAVWAITPRGRWHSLRLPASGAGPSPDRLLAGSEGALGVITAAWLKVLPLPEANRRAVLTFPTFEAGAEGLRLILQAGLYPTTARLLDERERSLGLAAGQGAALLLSFEAAGTGAARRSEALLRDAVRLARAAGGRVEGGVAGAQRAAGEERYRSAFFAGPYLRDLLLSFGVVAETFETAVTWDRLFALRSAVLEAAERCFERFGGNGFLSCRLTHAYPDGAAPYFTVLFPAPRGEELDRWRTVKERVSAAILERGGTITHHHAVGRDHLPWYCRQQPAPFGSALRAVKQAVDPHWVMNPGVLLAPRGPALVQG